MRSRGSSADESRADAAARRLAMLAADLGAEDVTRVVPSRRAVPLEEPPPPGCELPVLVPQSPPAQPSDPGGPPSLPRPGRHAARRPQRAGVSLPGLGSAHLAVVAVLVAAGIALTAWWVVRDQAEPAAAPESARTATTASALVAGASAGPSSGPGAAGPDRAAGTVTVDVTGKVRRPGIVVLDAGARVVDAVEAAGGERNGVDLSTLNLARVLVDGEQIVVGAAAAAAAPAGGGAPPAGTGAPVLVNLNTATQPELEALPEVGPVTAQAILAWRDAHGGFTSVDELLEVDGIGQVTLERLAAYVTV